MAWLAFIGTIHGGCIGWDGLAVRAALGNEMAATNKKRDLDGGGTSLLGDFFSFVFP
jgi:hypothetical protein